MSDLGVCLVHVQKYTAGSHTAKINKPHKLISIFQYVILEVLIGSVVC